MYADSVTDSMERAIVETQRRREIQQEYNTRHGITPKTVVKEVRDVLEISSSKVPGRKKETLTKEAREAQIRSLTRQMQEAARMLEFEYAAKLRDQIQRLQKEK